MCIFLFISQSMIFLHLNREQRKSRRVYHETYGDAAKPRLRLKGYIVALNLLFFTRCRLQPMQPRSAVKMSTLCVFRDLQPWDRRPLSLARLPDPALTMRIHCKLFVIAVCFGVFLLLYFFGGNPADDPLLAVVKEGNSDSNSQSSSSASQLVHKVASKFTYRERQHHHHEVNVAAGEEEARKERPKGGSSSINRVAKVITKRWAGFFLHAHLAVLRDVLHAVIIFAQISMTPWSMIQYSPPVCVSAVQNWTMAFLFCCNSMQNCITWGPLNEAFLWHWWEHSSMYV